MPSLWSVKKGTDAVREAAFTVRGSTHYEDYNNFNTCTVSTLKGTQAVKIRIGHRPICPECGDTHGEEKQLRCEYCETEYDTFCDYCGQGWNSEDDYYDERINPRDTHACFCCSECARNAGYEYAEDIEEWIGVDYLYKDDYDGYYYYRTDDSVDTEDGNTYSSYENAERAGYRLTDAGEWFPEHEVYMCDRCDCFVHSSFWNADFDVCDDCAEELEEEETTAACVA